MSKNKIKVLIELDEELFKNVVKQTKHGYIGSDVWIAVANGTPYYPSGDAISRRVMKDLISDKSIPIKFEEGVRGNWQHSSGVLLSDIYKVIDNAPPVEPDRPKGEYISVDNLFAKCSICGNFTRVLKKYNMPNFCPACGADMRPKGGTE